MKVIAGKLNKDNIVNYWLCDIEATLHDSDIGNYAIVENRDDYDLVKIVGIVDTNEKYAKYITGVNINKKVVSIIERNVIRED